MKIFKPRLKTSILQRLNFFSVRVVNACTALPDNVISAATMDFFKNSLDQFNKYRHGAQEAPV